MNNFETALATFVEGVKAKATSYKEWRLDAGRRYVRLVADGSAFLFVDKTNGDVLKSASWKAPAKHARGNIFDAANGLAAVGPYGPAYLYR